MAGEVNFSGKLSKEINIKDLKVEGLSDEKKAIFDKMFDLNNDGKVNTDELIKVIAEIDADSDGKLTDQEISVKGFPKIPTSDRQNVTQAEYVAYIKALAAKNAEEAKNDNVGNGYTIQLGEQIDDLVMRVLKSQGIEQPSAEQKKNCRKVIIDNNPKAIAKDGNGNYKWLLAGAKIYLPTDTTSDNAKKTVKDQNNHDEVVEKYKSWRRGEIKNFTYSIDDDGQRHEVRGGEKQDFQAGSSGGSRSSGASGGSRRSASPTSVDLSKAVDVDKLKGGDVTVDGKTNTYTDQQVRDIAKEGLDVLSQLKDENNIENVKKDDDHSRYIISLKNGGTLFVKYDGDGNITNVHISKKDEQWASVGINADGKLSVNVDDNSSYDFEANHGVKDFGAIEQLIKAHDKVREVMGLPKRGIVDFTAITDGDLDGNNRKTVEDKIKATNSVIQSLENSSDIASVGNRETVDNDHEEVNIIMKDNSKIKVYIKDNDVYKLDVISGDSEVSYDLKDNKIVVKTGSNGSVEAYDVINDIDAVKAFAKMGLDGGVAPASSNKPVYRGQTIEKSKVLTSYKEGDNTVTVYSNKSGKASVIEKTTPDGKVIARAVLAQSEVQSGNFAYERLNGNKNRFDLSSLDNDQIYRSSNGKPLYYQYTEYDSEGNVTYDETATRVKQNIANERVREALLQNVNKDNIDDFIAYTRKISTSAMPFMKTVLYAAKQVYSNELSDPSNKYGKDYQIFMNYNNDYNVRLDAFKRICEHYNLGSYDIYIGKDVDIDRRTGTITSTQGYFFR